MRKYLRACLNFPTAGIFGSGRAFFARGERGIGVPMASETGVKSAGAETKSRRVGNSKQALIVAAAGVLAACGGGKGDYDASGVFEATEVTVSARGAGELVLFDIREGESVAAGEALGLIDTTQLHLRKVQLAGSLKAAGARRLNVGRQVASLRQQLATAKSERARFEKLVRENAATRTQLDDIEAAVALLETELAARTENLTKGNAGLDGEIEAMEAQLAQLEDQIAKSVVASPVAGVVLSKYAEQGELAPQGRPLFKVGDLENMFLRVYITADQLTTMQIGQQVRVFADWGADQRREYPGTVSWISDAAEFTPRTIQTRNERANLVYAVRVAVTNDGYIKTGMYGDIGL